MDHAEQLRDLLRYYESAAAADCPHTALNREAIRWALDEIPRLQRIIDGLADRVAGQSELLSKRAER